MCVLEGLYVYLNPATPPPKMSEESAVLNCLELAVSLLK